MRSVMKHKFFQVPTVNIPRSTFDRSHGITTSFDASYLIPILVDEIYPGETVKCDFSGFVRLSTPTFPIMDNLTFDSFFFFGPIRQLWTNARKFHGEQVDPGDSISYTIPQCTATNQTNMSRIWDYFGLPTQVNAQISVNALPFRLYNHCFNEWFRDQNLQDTVDFPTGDGPDAISTYYGSIQKRGKRHDYFTSCLTAPQKGTAISLSLGTEARVYGKNMDFDDADDTGNRLQIYDQLGTSATLKSLTTAGGAGDYVYGKSNTSGSGAAFADLTTATASTVNELRQSVQIQHLLEVDARSGTRYPEIIKSHFQTIFPDLTYRPEYLGGGSSRIQINPVAQTDTNVGDLGAFGTCGFTGHGFTKSFTEHGYILGLICVRADLRYQEGIDKMWLRDTRYDFYYPSLANLGEQAVLNKEIYVDATDLGDGTSEEVFGYQEAWADLRYKKSMITGKMRSNDANTLDAWHLAEEFGDTPSLDSTFIQDASPVDRVIVTATEPHFIMDGYFNYMHTRPLPIYSIPGFGARF